MSRILTNSDIVHLRDIAVSPALWSVIIPAAGKGSRLGSDKPKILYPVLGHPLIEWVISAFTPFCSSAILVVSPAGREQVQDAINALEMTLPILIVVQEEPKGMAHAVHLTRDIVQTKNVAIVWGDQVTVNPNTIRYCMVAHEVRPDAGLTLPTCMKNSPYISFERDPDDRLVRVLHAREGEIHENIGENDCGLFFFDSRSLFQVLSDDLKSGSNRGNSTGEWNLLPLLPKFEQSESSIQTLRIASESETLGVNTKEEARAAEEILLRRQNEFTR